MLLTRSMCYASTWSLAREGRKKRSQAALAVACVPCVHRHWNCTIRHPQTGVSITEYPHPWLKPRLTPLSPPSAQNSNDQILPFKSPKLQIVLAWGPPLYRVMVKMCWLSNDQTHDDSTSTTSWVGICRLGLGVWSVQNPDSTTHKRCTRAHGEVPTVEEYSTSFHCPYSGSDWSTKIWSQVVYGSFNNATVLMQFFHYMKYHIIVFLQEKNHVWIIPD
jgi:hypothetical protein